jgi:hypothetical protein
MKDAVSAIEDTFLRRDTATYTDNWASLEYRSTCKYCHLADSDGTETLLDGRKEPVKPSIEKQDFHFIKACLPTKRDINQTSEARWHEFKRKSGSEANRVL